MNFKKSVLDKMEKCYATLGIDVDGEPYLFFAGEGNGILKAYYGKDYQKSEMIWQGGGGTMSIVPLKRKPGWVLVSRGFYSMVNSQDSSIEIIRFLEGHFTHEKICELPYLHRFTVISADGIDYLIACSIASYKENLEDWDHPGHIYVAELPHDLDSHFSLKLTPLEGDFTMNHGFYSLHTKEKDIVYIAAKEGVFSLFRNTTDGSWSIDKLIKEPLSDIAVMDIDNDGEYEIAALLPFHGNQLKVFKKTNGIYCDVYSCHEDNDFYHAICGAELHAEKLFVCGARRQSAQLFLLRWDKETQSFYTQIVEENIGPSNVAIFSTKENDILLSANRQIHEAAVYSLIR